ncbi:hypothetical protein [Hyphobacterium sp.]|uniref:hypothetical protein n=1 Tax=Hyphobacterium sp. TaxID=2004662 RepID=UPI003749CBAA
MSFFEIKKQTLWLVEDQLRRGVSIRVHLHNVREHDWGYSLNNRPIVQYTTLLSGNGMVIELIDPNPQFEECGEPLQTIWMIDLTADEFDLIDVIEAISDHLIDHQTRFVDPCGCHPDERCVDCHLRPEPCSNQYLANSTKKELDHV